MNNILILGNGFDRQLGLKTDYISFLDWIEEQNYSDKGVANLVNNMSHMDKPIGSVSEATDFILSLFNKTDSIEIQIFRESLFHSVVRTKEQDYSLQLIRLIILGKQKFPIGWDFSKQNIWYSYFNFLRKFVSLPKENEENVFNVLFTECINSEGRWIDLETLIELNVRHIINHPDIISANYINICTFTRYLLLCDGELRSANADLKKEIDKLLWDDFIEFKNLLTKYLEIQYSNKVNLNSQHIGLQLNVQKVINFNYTHTVSKLINNGFLTFAKADVYNVHGDINDKNNVVFGLDTFFRDLPLLDDGKSSEEIRLLSDEVYVKYSKVYQLLALQKEKDIYKIGKADKLTILGHSLGVQDYSYFFSIFDRSIDVIEIEYICYHYSNNKGENKLSGQDALFKLLNSYEKISRKRVLHKMIFEGRIKFREAYLPQIFE